jgi:DNA-binding MarR family transcriptional regulator
MLNSMQDAGAMTMYETCLLHARADRALRSLVGVRLEQYKLTMMEWLLLSVVCEGPPEGMSMSAVAQALDVTLPQITALATKLLNLKLVRQKTQSHDRRSRHVLATGKGKSFLEDIEEELSTALHEWMSELPRPEYEAYMGTVKWLASHRPPGVGGGAAAPAPTSEQSSAAS